MDWIKCTDRMPLIEGQLPSITCWSDDVIVCYEDGSVGANNLKGQCSITEIEKRYEEYDKTGELNPYHIKPDLVMWENQNGIKLHGRVTHWMPMPNPAED